ncbi:MAG: hypothetical protein ABIR16_02500 [Dokdonella sp.]
MSKNFLRRAFALPVLLVILATLAAVASAQQASRLEELMGSERFKQAGLDQQSPEQLKVLQDWIVAHGEEIAERTPPSEAASAASAATSKRGWFGKGSAKSKAPSSTVTSRIDGEFIGWRGNSTLSLENGQQWRIRDGSSLSTRNALDHPEVTIKPGMVSGWYLQVKGYNTTALVEPAN